MRTTYNQLLQEKLTIEEYLKNNVEAPDFHKKVTRLNNIEFRMNKTTGEKAKTSEINRSKQYSSHQIIY